MENKKKPSIVTLSDSYHFQFKPGKGDLLTPEMLDWPIFERLGYYPIKEPRLKTYRNVVRALMGISPFEAVLSTIVDEENKRFVLTKKVQGEIFLNGESVVSFRYHSKKENKPFVSIEEWPEIENEFTTTSIESDKDWQRVYQTLSEWTVEQWVDFFFKRIKDKAEALNKKAQAKRSDAQSLESRAEKILEAFS
jgi:hypothetical protein